MHATSDAPTLQANRSNSFGPGVPLAKLHLIQLLILSQWSAAMWVFGQRQLSRYSTFLAGGAPIGM